jgi:hypothetical protein
MKRVLFALLQFVLFLLVFAVGSFLPPFHIERVVSVTPEGTRMFIWDGVVLMTLLWAMILLIETLRKRIASAGLWTTAAFALALVAGLAAKLGFLTIDR